MASTVGVNLLFEGQAGMGNSASTAPTEVYSQPKGKVSNGSSRGKGALNRMVSDCANSSAHLVPNPNAQAHSALGRVPSAFSTSPSKETARNRAVARQPSKATRNLSFRPQSEFHVAEGARRPNALMKSVTAPSVVAEKVKERGRDLVNALTKSRSMMSADTATSNQKPSAWYLRNLAPFEIVSMGVHFVKGTPLPTKKDAAPLSTDVVLVGDYFRVRVKTANGKALPLDPMAYSVTLRLCAQNDPIIGKNHCRIYCPDKPAVMEYALYEVPNVADVIDIYLRVWLASDHMTSNKLPYRIKIGRGMEKDSKAVYTEPFHCLKNLPGQNRRIPKYTPMIAGPAPKGRGALVKVNTDISATMSKKCTSTVKKETTPSTLGRVSNPKMRSHWVSALFTDPYSGLYRVPLECEALLQVLSDPKKCEAFRPTAVKLLNEKKSQQAPEATTDYIAPSQGMKRARDEIAHGQKSKKRRENQVYRNCDEDAAVAALMRVGSASTPDHGWKDGCRGTAAHDNSDDDTASTQTADTMIYTGEEE